MGLAKQIIYKNMITLVTAYFGSTLKYVDEKIFGDTPNIKRCGS